jgi:Ricin-type beta-trefoil lectin domain
MKLSVLLLVALLAALSTPARAMQILESNSGQCINVPWHGVPVEGIGVRVKQCDPWKNQQWTITGGQITGIGGLCLDVRGGQPANGAKVIYASCSQSPSQFWQITGGQVLSIGGKCLDVAGGQAVNGAQLILLPCSSASTQQWTVQ